MTFVFCETASRKNDVRLHIDREEIGTKSKRLAAKLIKPIQAGRRKGMVVPKKFVRSLNAAEHPA